MKAKLIKKGDVYFLDKLKIDGYFTIANSLAKPNGLMYNLSLKNCQAIERGYDLDELIDNITPKNGTTGNISERIGFVKGFQKALELMGDKRFSEDDVKNAIRYGMGLCLEKRDWAFGISGFCEQYLKEYIQSLQQTEWEVTFNPDEKDAEGCLILKRI